MAEDKKTGRSEQSKTLKMLKNEVESSKDGKAMRAELKAQGKSRKEIAVEFAKIAMMQKKSIDAEEAYRQKDRKDTDKRDEQYYKRMEEIQKEKQASGMSKEAAKEIASAVAEGEERSFQKQEDKREKRIKREKTFTGRLINKAMMKIPQSVGGDKEKQIEETRERKGFFKSLKSMFSKKDKDDGGGIAGFLGKIFKKIKGVFSLVLGNFLLIGAVVVGLIASMNIEQLKEVWKNLKEAFTAIYEFLEPIVTYLWNWIKESVLPELIDFFIKGIAEVTTMFKSIKERFDGFGEMTLGEKVTAVFDAFGDLGTMIGNLAGNLVEGIVNIFGGDGEKAKKEYWEPIQKFFGDFFSGIKLLFSDPAAGLKKMWNSVFGGDGLAAYFWEKFIKPLANFIKNIAADIIGDKWAIKLGLKKETIENQDRKIAEENAKKEKKARFQAGSEGMSKYNRFFTGRDKEGIAAAAPQELKDMKAYMEQKNQTHGDYYQLVTAALKKADEKQAKIDTQSAIADASNKANVDAGGFANYSAFHSSAEGKAFLNQKFGGKGYSTKKGERAFAEYQKKGHMGVMDSSELGQIKKDEGFREGVYKDTVGIKTIGYGFNLERQGSQEALDAAGIKKTLADLKGGKANLTEEEASRLMNGEMGHFKTVAENYVGSSVWKTLSANRQGILTNMAYNMGEGGLGQFKNLKAAIQKGDWKQAQKEMADSKWAGQVKGRADRLVARMGGDEKSGSFGSIQTANNTAKDSNGQPIIVSPTTVGPTTTIHKEETTMLAGTATNPDNRQGTTVA